MTTSHHLAARARLRALALRPVVFALAALLAGADASLFAQETARVLAPPVGAHEEAIEQARSRAQSVVAEANLPGLSAAVGLDGEVVWAEGFGWADLEQRVPISPLSRFRIGSASKPLTAAAVGLPYERGLLDLDAPVQTYVPSFPEKRWPINTRQLMGHIAGIRHYSSDEEVLSVEDYGSNVLAGLDIFADDSLLFRPGTESSYSTYGWNLVAAVVQAAADEPFLDFMRKEVFAPLGMRHCSGLHSPDRSASRKLLRARRRGPVAERAPRGPEQQMGWRRLPFDAHRSSPIRLRYARRRPARA